MDAPLIRPANAEDIRAILDLQYEAYPAMSKLVAWQRGHLEQHQRVFPEGQLVAEQQGKVVASCANFITRSTLALQPHTYRVITGRGTFNTHDPQGDTLYGAEIMVAPQARRQGIATRFYKERFEIVKRLGLHYFVSGGRIPGYQEVAGKVPVETYVQDVAKGERTDRTLSMQLKAGLTLRGLLPEYLNDPKSGNYASLLVWTNPLLADAAETVSAIPLSVASTNGGRAARTTDPAVPPASW